MFPIIDVSSWEVYRAEPMGTKAKDWRLSPDDGQPWLLKFNRKDNRTGIFAGEDWSEKIAAELAELLGIPHAIVELASVNSLPGVIVKDFVSDRTKKKLTHGNELLAATISAYPKNRNAEWFNTRFHACSMHFLSPMFIYPQAGMPHAKCKVRLNYLRDI